MNRYLEEYQRKLTDIDGALAHIKSGDSICYSWCATEPASLLGSLHTLHGKVENINVFGALEIGRYPFMQEPQYQDTFTVDSGFFMGSARCAHAAGLISPFPTHLHNMADRRYSYRRPNVMLVSATPMDEHGYFLCSLCQIHEQLSLDMVDTVLLEVNPNLPRVGGDTEIHISQVDAIVEAAHPIPQLPASKLSPEDVAIGSYIASLVNDGDTIQLGIGAIPDAAAVALKCKHDLGVHTEMITNSLVDLVECGALTGRKKSLHRGKIIGTFALGNQRLYDFMNNNPSVQILGGSYVNAPHVIAQNDNMVSINTCVSVDLTGQVNSESIGSLHYSGSGGQADTAYGAVHAPNGRSIIALHSTAKKGTVSTINAVLSPGAIVTLSRNNVDYIVTEYGIAPMKGRSVRERRDNLIAVAHPDFRAELRREAEAFKIW